MRGRAHDHTIDNFLTPQNSTSSEPPPNLTVNESINLGYYPKRDDFEVTIQPFLSLSLLEVFFLLAPRVLFQRLQIESMGCHRLQVEKMVLDDRIDCFALMEFFVVLVCHSPVLDGFD